MWYRARSGSDMEGETALEEKYNLSDALVISGFLNGLHGNAQIPKVIGAAQQYEFTGVDSLKPIADVFWDRVVRHHTYAIGGNTEGSTLGRRTHSAGGSAPPPPRRATPTTC